MFWSILEENNISEGRILGGVLNTKFLLRWLLESPGTWGTFMRCGDSPGAYNMYLDRSRIRALAVAGHEEAFHS